MDPILDRLTKLLALATNPSTPVEEARSAALIAVRTIVEKDVRLSRASTGVPRPPPIEGFQYRHSSDFRAHPGSREDLAAFFENLFRATESQIVNDAESAKAAFQAKARTRRRRTAGEPSTPMPGASPEPYDDYDPAAQSWRERIGRTWPDWTARDKTITEDAFHAGWMAHRRADNLRRKATPMKAKFQGRCGTCGDVVEPGDPIFWRQASPPNCERCGPIREEGR